jgi:hypothetical protein
VPVIGVPFGYTSEPVAKFGPDRLVDSYDRMWEAIMALLGEAPSPRLPGRH